MEEATMDMKSFTDKLLHSEELKNVPIEYIFQVAFFILEIINKGEVYYDSTTSTDITG